MKRGVIYSCAGSQRFLQEAIVSANSVKKFMPNIEICLFHNYEPSTLLSLDTSIFTQIKKISLPSNLDGRFSGHMSAFLGKLYSILETPYDYTLFLDTDTEVKKQISGMFDLLDKFDIAIAPGPMTQRPTDSNDVLNELPLEFPELNTGVILYKMNDKMRRFLGEWKDTFLENRNNLYRAHTKGGEQVSLRYLLYNREDIRMYILSTQGIPNMFNYRWGPVRKEFVFSNKVVIHHTRNRK